MKKIILLLNIFALCLFASCSSNEYVTFDDANAFVAFGGASYAISEEGGSLQIPVTLASVKGIATTVTVEGVDDKAKSGKDYVITDGTLEFNADNRTAYVEVKIINRPGEYTGDMSFTLKFSDLGGVNAGFQSTTTITINDLDHPLSFILGDWTFSGTKYPSTPTSWTTTILKDAEDDSKVWFYDLMGNPGWAGMDIIYYGVVNPEKTMITIPLGQESEYKYGGTTPVTLFGLAADLNGYDTGNIVVTIEEDGKKLNFGNDYGMWFYIVGAGSIGTYLPGITAVRP